MSNITLGSVQQALGNALNDSNAASQLLANPADFFRQNGLDLSAGRDAEFNQHFQNIDPNLLATFSTVARGEQTPVRGLPPGWSCGICQAGVYSIAVALTVLGAPEISGLTATSTVVVSLAEFSGIEAAAVATFLKGLPGTVWKNVGSVATAICRWLHAC